MRIQVRIVGLFFVSLFFVSAVVRAETPDPIARAAQMMERCQAILDEATRARYNALTTEELVEFVSFVLDDAQAI